MKKTILIVDDEADVRSIVAELLDLHGYTAVTAGSALDAYALMNAAAIDIVLSDILMPGFDGFQLYRMIKRNPQLKHIPVVFMSGFAPHMDLAPSVIIKKPFSIHELLPLLDEALLGLTRS